MADSLRTKRKRPSAAARACALMAFAAGVFLAAAAGARGEESIGYVFEVRGEWALEGDSGGMLSAGREVPAGGRIRNLSGGASDRIVVASRGGEIILRKLCDAGGCGSPVELPRAARRRPSFLGMVMDTAMRLLRSDPERYRVHIVRAEELRDAVVRLRDGALDLSPVFAGTGGGTYYLRLTPLSQTARATPESARQIVFRWEPARPSPLAARGLRPGLYELTLLKGDGLGPTPVNAWLLAAGGTDYRRAAKSFAGAKRLTRRMEKDVSTQAARGFERAWLDHLSKQAPK